MHKKNDNTEIDSCKPKELESCGCGCSEPVENHINHHIEESEDHHEAQNIARKVGEDNIKTLRIAAISKKTGDLVTRKVFCQHGKVKINVNL